MSGQVFEASGYILSHQIIAKKTINSIASFLNEGWIDAVSSVYPDLAELARTDIKALSLALQKRETDLAHADKVVLDAHTGHFSLKDRLDPILLALPREQLLQRLLKDIFLSETLFMHMPPMARFILPRNEFARVPPHRDSVYNTHMERFVTVWIPFVPITKECGGIRIFPGSHLCQDLKLGRLESDKTVNPLWAAPLDTSGLNFIDCHMEIGDALIMHSNLVHQSLANTGSHIRLSMDLRFFAEADGSTKHFLNVQTGTVIAPTESTP